jgi:hypothetical protein
VLGTQACRDARFGEEARHHLFVRRVLGPNQFDCDRAIELQVRGAQHQAHAALGYQRLDAILAAEQLPGHRTAGSVRARHAVGLTSAFAALGQGHDHLTLSKLCAAGAD